MKYVAVVAMVINPRRFSSTYTYIDMLFLMKEKGPPGLVGKLNIPGGKIELGEAASGAARREFGEETGLVIPQDHKDRFRHFYRHRYRNQNSVDYYALALTDQEFSEIKTQPGEEKLCKTSLIRRGDFNFEINSGYDAAINHDLYFLIPMAYQTLTGVLEQNLD
ncbi:NUDIX domain-containing protein [Xylophilus phage Lumi]|nr:NUDIX domain-containing protein [Xylophilus phage Lumi]